MQVWINVDAVEAYAQQVEVLSHRVSELMEELQSAISRAKESWQDESIVEAEAQAESARLHIGDALSDLGEEIDHLRQQAEWGKEYLRIR